MTAFQTLGELGTWVGDNPHVEIVDAGVPLSSYVGGEGGRGATWRTQPSVRKVAGFVARNIVSIPLHVYERVSDTSRKRVRDGELAAVLSTPSSAPSEYAGRFFEKLLLDGLLHDRYCAYMRATASGTYELVRIPVRRWRLKTDGLDRITAVLLASDAGQWTAYDPADFLLDVGYAERGGQGTSPLVTMRHLLDEQREAVEYRRSVWKRGARIPGVIERPDPWPADGKAREAFRRSWAAFQAGGGQEGGTPLLEDGMTYRELNTFNPKDSQDLEGRRLTDIEVASAYHIPPELVGARPGNFSNLQAFRQMLYSVALGPYIAAFEEALNATLVPRLAGGRDLYIEANVEAKMRGSFEESAKVTQSATGAPWMTRNEARAMRNLPAIDGGDDLVTPLNVIVGGQASPNDSAPKQIGRRPRTKAAPSDAYRETLEYTLRAFFEDQRTEILAALASKDGEEWWDGARWDTQLANELHDLAQTVATLTGQAAAEELGFEPDEYDTARTIAFLRAMVTTRAHWINQATHDQIVEALAGAERDVAGVFDTAENQRSGAASAALVTALAGWASIEAARQLAPDRTTKTWIVTSKKPRATHRAMDGVTVPVSELFPNGMDWPGDAVGGAAEVANCMCTVRLDYDGGR